MTRSDLQVNFRMPASLKAALEAAAKENHRSLTAELVARLEESFSSDMHQFIRTTVEPLANGPEPELEELQLNLEIVLEQVKHIAAARKK